MEKIKGKYVILAVVSLLVFVVCLIAAFAQWIFLIPTGVSLLSYVVIDRKFLRCPYCAGFLNVGDLLYARNHEYHCIHCGKRVQISK